MAGPLSAAGAEQAGRPVPENSLVQLLAPRPAELSVNVFDGEYVSKE